MGNIRAPYVKYFDSFTAEIKGKFQRVRNLINHNVTSGNYHEEILRNIIKNFLTKRYSVKTGFIFKSPGEVSNQIDIMIIDENEPAAYIFQEGDFAIVLPKCVRAIIEVKTTLHIPDFLKAVDTLGSAKKLIEFPPRMTAILFGYGGTKPTENNLQSWFSNKNLSTYQENYGLGPDAIMFFTASCLLTQRDEKGKATQGGKYYHKAYRIPKGNDLGWQLSILLAMIINSCETDDASRRNTFPEGLASKLIQEEGSSIDSTRFSFGEGQSELNNYE